jgi:hypothetical protein
LGGEAFPSAFEDDAHLVEAARGATGFEGGEDGLGDVRTRGLITTRSL